MVRRVAVTVVCMLALGSVVARAAFVEAPALTFARAFHIVGIPGVKRNARVDVHFASDRLLITKQEKDVLTVPFSRITRVQVLDSTRMYAKSTYAAVLAAGLPGLLLMAKKKHVDSLLIDYVNQRGGQMGIIVQVPAGQGNACREWLRKHAIAVDNDPDQPVGPDVSPK